MMQTTPARRIALMWGVLGVMLLAGCRSTTPPPRRPPPATAPIADITNTDPCAMRLHDVSGDLLLTYAQTGRLPDTLDELDSTSAPLVCPVSNQPYVYNPGGIHLPERNAYVVLYDPTPAHAGMRWAVTVSEPSPTNPLVTKVIALPERFFVLHPPIPR